MVKSIDVGIVVDGGFTLSLSFSLHWKAEALGMYSNSLCYKKERGNSLLKYCLYFVFYLFISVLCLDL